MLDLAKLVDRLCVFVWLCEALKLVKRHVQRKINQAVERLSEEEDEKLDKEEKQRLHAIKYFRSFMLCTQCVCTRVCVCVCVCVRVCFPQLPSAHGYNKTIYTLLCSVTQKDSHMHEQYHITPSFS